MISAVVSLTLVPTLSARWLKAHDKVEDSAFGRRSKAVVDWLIGRYDVALTWVLDRQAATLIVAVGTLVLTVILFLIIPKGLFPTQDTGLIQGVTEAAQTGVLRRHGERPAGSGGPASTDPDVASLTSFIGVDGTNTTLNSGRMLIELQPFGHRSKTRPAIIADLQREAARVPGVALYLQPVQDLTIDATASRTQYQFALQGADTATVAQWAASWSRASCQNEPKIRNVASDLQNEGLSAFIDIDRDTAARLGDHRRPPSTTPSTTRSASGSSRPSSPSRARNG